jgi:hypothetical protein
MRTAAADRLPVKIQDDIGNIPLLEDPRQVSAVESISGDDDMAL